MHTPQTTGPGDGVEPIGLVRRRDRGTSWEAAMRQANGKRAALQRRVYAVLSELGPQTHEQILQHVLDTWGKYAATASGARTRTAELVTAGWVVADGKRRGSTGSPMTVWRIATDEDPLPEPDDGWTKPVERRLEAARERAEWEAGDRRIADIVLRAYLNPGRDARELAAEQGLDR